MLGFCLSLISGKYAERAGSINVHLTIKAIFVKRTVTAIILNEDEKQTVAASLVTYGETNCWCDGLPKWTGLSRCWCFSCSHFEVRRGRHGC